MTTKKPTTDETTPATEPGVPVKKRRGGDVTRAHAKRVATGAAVDAVKARAAKLKRKQATRPRKRTRAAGTEQQAIDMAHEVNKWQVLELKIKGLTWRQIGAQMQISHSHARDLAFEALAEQELEGMARVPAYRAIEHERLEEAHRVLVPLVHGKVPPGTLTIGKGKQARTVPVPNDPIEVARVQVAAVGRLVHVSARRSALLGLDAPLKIAPTRPDGTAWHDKSDEELEQEIRAKEALLAGTTGPTIPGEARRA